MGKMIITFPNGFTAKATTREKEEPEMVAQMWSVLKDNPTKLYCYHTFSTGDVYNAYPRAPYEPVETGNQTDFVGHENKLITDLDCGDLTFTGWNFSINYGHGTEPVPVGGPVVAKIDPEYMKGFCEACKDVWLHDYVYHKLAIIYIAKGED